MNSAVLAAAVVATGAVTAAATTAVVTFFLARERMLEERQCEQLRAALHDFGEKVLEYRDRAIQYGLAARQALLDAELVDGELKVAVSVEIWRAWESARAALKMSESRVDDPRVRATSGVWRKLIESNVLSRQEVPNADEEAAFDAVIEALSDAAQSLSRRNDRQNWLDRWSLRAR